MEMINDSEKRRIADRMYVDNRLCTVERRYYTPGFPAYWKVKYENINKINKML